jgi:hypothetical protein
MTLEKELQNLRRRKAEEARQLHRIFARTKRDIRRAVSPDRLIRRHLPATLAIAAAAGMLLAPRPGPRSKKASPKPERREGSFLPGWLRHLITRFLPQLAEYLPEHSADSEPATAPAPPAESGQKEAPAESQEPALADILRAFALDLAGLVLSKIDLQQLMAGLAAKLFGKEAATDSDDSPESCAVGHPINPHVTSSQTPAPGTTHKAGGTPAFDSEAGPNHPGGFPTSLL